MAGDEDDIGWGEDDGVVLKTLAPSLDTPFPIPPPHPHLLVPPPFHPIIINPVWPMQDATVSRHSGDAELRAHGTRLTWTASGVWRS